MSEPIQVPGFEPSGAHGVIALPPPQRFNASTI